MIVPYSVVAWRYALVHDACAESHSSLFIPPPMASALPRVVIPVPIGMHKAIVLAGRSHIKTLIEGGRLSITEKVDG